MLNEAFAKIPDGTTSFSILIRAGSTTQNQYQQIAPEKGVRQSMSRRKLSGQRGDRKFLGLLKSELLYLQEFPLHEHFKLELIEYSRLLNNRRARQS